MSAAAVNPFANCEFDQGVVDAFRPAFEACEALLRFSVENRPEDAPAEDPAGKLIFRTYVRSSKTYQASFLLAGRGYGVQAGMLNRSLFEDMLVAHWVKKNPDEAPKQYERNRLHAVEQMREALTKHGSGVEMEQLPALSEEERLGYAKEFGYRSWTGFNTFELAQAVEDEWPEGKFGRDLFWWVYDIAQRFNNLLLHHTPVALGLTEEEDEERGVKMLDVGPSLAHVHGALLGAFYCYTQTLSLVLLDKAEQLQSVSDEHFTKAFLTIGGQPK